MEMSNMNNNQMLQDEFLITIREQRAPVSIYLLNGIRLQGLISSFDKYSITLKDSITQLIYKHAISTIVPINSDPLSGTCYEETQPTRV